MGKGLGRALGEGLANSLGEEIGGQFGARDESTSFWRGVAACAFALAAAVLVLYLSA